MIFILRQCSLPFGFYSSHPLDDCYFFAIPALYADTPTTNTCTCVDTLTVISPNMRSFQAPLLRSPHDYRPLHSFRFSSVDAPARMDYSTSQRINLTSPEAVSLNVTFPLQGSTTTLVAAIISLVFIATISFAFIGARSTMDDPYFRLLLDETARISPGVSKLQDLTELALIYSSQVVLLGESVHINIDEPSITVRWSVIACGLDFVLSNSTNVHGSKLCGLPAYPLYVYVDKLVARLASSIAL